MVGKQGKTWMVLDTFSPLSFQILCYSFVFVSKRILKVWVNYLVGWYDSCVHDENCSLKVITTSEVGIFLDWLTAVWFGCGGNN